MPGAAYSVPSPIQFAIKYPILSFASAQTLPAIPVPAGWNASVRGLMATGTTTFSGSTTAFGLFQVGDGTTVNKYAQMQLGNTATPFASGATMTVFFPPPIAGVNVAGSGTSTPQAQSGLTGRNPNNPPSAGVSGPFLFAAGGTNIVPTVVPTAGTPVGVADVIMIIELSDVG